MGTSALTASVFEGLGYNFAPMSTFSPRTIDAFGLCATTRLIQCRDFGVHTNDVTRKFEGDPEGATDLEANDFIARRNVIEQVHAWAEENETEWTPILYMYEIIKSSGKRQSERDWGNLVFTDLTTTRFLLVMIFPDECDCGNDSHHDYGALTKFQADRFMSLLRYLYHTEQKAEWVHATYVTNSNPGYTLDPAFLRTLESSDSPNVFHVTAETFVPSLLAPELESIDTLLRQSNKSVPKSVRYEVLGSKVSRPDLSAKEAKNPDARQCARCDKTGTTKDLLLCSRCRLIHYCSRECQKQAWPTHKIVCKKA
ncbi:hypothetical protein C8R46DRAFT_1064376 [Mycena filopes]|nr:hypothetical protein C8R46DRAFT_1064376 [Mycena filopes]